MSIGPLLALLSRLTKARGDNLDYLDGSITSRASQASVDDVASVLAGKSSQSSVDAIKAETVVILPNTESIKTSLGEISGPTFDPATDSLEIIADLVRGIGGGGYVPKVSEFDANGTFTPRVPNTFVYIIAVGPGGNGSSSDGGAGGGGGAVLYIERLLVPTTIFITIGEGGSQGDTTLEVRDASGSAVARKITVPGGKNGAGFTGGEGGGALATNALISPGGRGGDQNVDGLSCHGYSEGGSGASGPGGGGGSYGPGGDGGSGGVGGVRGGGGGGSASGFPYGPGGDGYCMIVEFQ